MNISFIAKYRPVKLNDFTTDLQLIAAIRALIEVEDMNVLFVGNSSSGKTTLLYCILREYYGVGKDDPLPETNIMFINNLKEQGINYFRNEMKTFSQSHCSIRGKKKFIMIDDIDMINEQSQQVFRNYIDKYKNNIHFIATCSNIQKVIESMQSRLHMVNILSPTISSIETIMDKIIACEKMAIDAESRRYILDKSALSIRTVINNLEKCYIYGKPINYDLCVRLCSTISLQQFENYIVKLHEKNRMEAIQILQEINEYGYSVIDILEYFYSIVKTTHLLSEDEKYAIVPILCKYIYIFHSVHEDNIELALFTNSILTCPVFARKDSVENENNTSAIYV